nr:hypothetical protein [Tanacetum cinerariifolium]
MSFRLDTAYSRRVIRRIKNYLYAFSCEELAMIRRITFLDMPYLFSGYVVLDSDSHQEEIDVVTVTDDVLPPSVENDNSDEKVDDVDDLRVDNSISNSEHEFSESEDSDFDNPSVPLPPPEPPDEEFDFEIDLEMKFQV